MTDAQRRYMKARQRVETLMVNPALELLNASLDLVAAQQPEIDRLTRELEKAEIAVQMLRSMNEDGQFGARIALEQLWVMLHAKHQTQACENLRRLIASAGREGEARDALSRERFPDTSGQ